MSLSHTDISTALQRKGYAPAACKVAYDCPEGFEDITDKLDLPKSVLRDLAADGLEVYAPVPVPKAGAVEKVKAAISKARA